MVSTPFDIALAVWAAMSLVAFALYGIDKSRAKRGAWRISERTLLLSALLMGGPGAWAGMEFFRHKTQHPRFRVLVPLCCAVNAAAVYLAWRWG